MTHLRIVSFLPAATEMCYALGLGDAVVGVSHECDYPPEARTKPVVVRPVLPVERTSLAEIDAAVAGRIGTGASLYQVDERLLRDLRPTHILTQNLCQVCAPSGNEVTQVLKAIAPAPQILWLTPHSLAGVEENLRELAAATGRGAAADTLIAAGRTRVEAVARVTSGAARRPRVFCLEWVDPLYCSGHWVAEMVEAAGGTDRLSRRGTDSVRIPWSEVIAWAPEVLVVMPCGFKLGAAVEQTQRLALLPGWADLPAVRAGRVFAVDANAYFARPGPRLIDGIELLGHLLHPDLVPWKGPADAFQHVPFAPDGRPLRPARTKTCSRCGAPFRCGPATGQDKCWCDALPSVGPIAGAASDCLCPACLQAAIAAKRASG
jgi:iron complex transport system substrate-binding protein